MSQMLAEIAEQPAALERTLAECLPRIEALRKRLTSRRRLVVLVARGTSDNAAQFGRYLIEITTGIPVSLAAPSVTTVYHADLDWRDALVVGLSQSGESTDTNLCLESARARGAFTIGITNEAGSAMTRVVDELLLVRAGREKSVAATKTYSGQLMMMYLLAYALGAAIPLDGLRALPGSAAEALGVEDEVRSLAERYRYMESAVVIGRGLNYANAFEFALKLMETCYVVAERFSGADFAHGPIALVEKGFPVFLFAAPGRTGEGAVKMLERLSGLQAETVVITSRARRDEMRLATRSVVLPDPPAGDPADLFSTIPFVIPAQLFAGLLAAHKGLDPDQPRTLSKVTKTV